MSARRCGGLGLSAKEHRDRQHDVERSTREHAAAAARLARNGACGPALRELVAVNRNFGAAIHESQSAGNTRYPRAASAAAEKAESAYVRYCKVESRR